MAIKNIIAGGIGFSPGSTKFIPTLGFSIAAATTEALIYAKTKAVNLLGESINYDPLFFGGKIKDVMGIVTGYTPDGN